MTLSEANLEAIIRSPEGGMAFTWPESRDRITWPTLVERRNSPALRLQDICRRESVEVAQIDQPDVSVLPGKAATVDVIAEGKLRASIVELINHFFTEGHSRQAGHVTKISRDTHRSAIALFSSLPLGLVPPKLAPDEDGGLIMVWESGDASALAVLEGWTIHVVKAPATAQAEYFDDVPYDRERIPTALLQAILTE